jgi:hypothetical protein
MDFLVTYCGFAANPKSAKTKFSANEMVYIISRETKFCLSPDVISDVWKRRNTVSLKSDFLTLYRVRKRHLQHEEIPSILVKTEPVENFNT